MASKRNVILSTIVRALAVIALLALGIGIFIALFATRPQPAPAVHEQLHPRVAVMAVQAVPVVRQFEGFGTAMARRSASVPAQVRGVVMDVPQEIVAGNRVERGQVLATLDEEDYQREVDITTARIADIQAQLRRLDVELQGAQQRLELAEEEVELAEADLQRVLEAFEVGGATQREVDQQRQAVAARRRERVAAWEQIEQIEPRRDQLQALLAEQQTSLRTAFRNLERAVITAPITGVLEAVNVDPGESVAMDQPVARIVDLRVIDIPIRLPASARPHVAVGNEVVLAAAANVGNSWTGTIARISPTDDEATRTFTVYVEYQQDPDAHLNDDDDASLLAPGQFVRARVDARRTENRQVVPRRALAADRIRVIDNGIVRSRRVNIDYHVQNRYPQLGLPDTHWLVLREALPEGTLVVVDGARRLAEGMRVEPITALAGDGEADEADPHSHAAGRGDGEQLP